MELVFKYILIGMFSYLISDMIMNVSIKLNVFVDFIQKYWCIKCITFWSVLFYTLYRPDESFLYTGLSVIIVLLLERILN